ncbi:MAG: 3D domain-containing protein [Parcubacteria group bacterium]|nr:3D domain-containing protein [Parcubacteria group bacterium]
MKSKRSTLKVYITAYSSSPDETDDTPDITASGSRTRDGIIATNMLPFGTKVRIPRLFGKKLFVVEDRMHSRFSERIDVWFPGKQDAKNFGIRYAEIEVL